MKKVIIIIISILLASAFYGCKKKEACPQKETTAKELLTMDEWRYISRKDYRDGVGMGITGYGNWSCVFAPSGDYYLIDGSNSLIYYGIYTFMEDREPFELYIKNHGDPQPVRYIVDTLTADVLMYHQDTLINGHNWRFEYKFERLQ